MGAEERVVTTQGEAAHTVLEGTGVSSLCAGGVGVTRKSNHTAIRRVRYIKGKNRLSWVFNGERVVTRYCGEGGVTDRMMGKKRKIIRYCP